MFRKYNTVRKVYSMAPKFAIKFDLNKHIEKILNQ